MDFPLSLKLSPQNKKLKIGVNKKKLVADKDMGLVEVARNHGIHFTVVPGISINEGIDAARNTLNRCWFDEVKCDKGISSLESYKKEWNDRHGCWSSHPTP